MSKEAKDLRVSVKEQDQIVDLFKRGHDAASKDPEKYWKQRQKREDKIPVFSGEKLDKAMFVGPRGGKWADAKHTIPWDPEKHSARFEQIKKPEKLAKIGKKKLREQLGVARKFLSRHENCLPDVLAGIRGLSGENSRVEGRVKEVESAIGKALIRKPEKYGLEVSNIQDGAGFRVVHTTVDQVMTTVAKLRAQYAVTREEDYITVPLNHYRSYHLILKDEATGLEYEVQVRTRNQSDFADWSHRIYKPENPEQEAHKIDPEVLDYQARISSYFWQVDTGAIPPSKPDCPPMVAKVYGCL